MRFCESSRKFLLYHHLLYKRRCNCENRSKRLRREICYHLQIYFENFSGLQMLHTLFNFIYSSFTRLITDRMIGQKGHLIRPVYRGWGGIHPCPQKEKCLKTGHFPRNASKRSKMTYSRKHTHYPALKMKYPRHTFVGRTKCVLSDFLVRTILSTNIFQTFTWHISNLLLELQGLTRWLQKVNFVICKGI